MTDDTGTAGHLTLDGALTLRTIETVYGRICEAMAQHASLVIDCTGAAEVDLSFVQLLIAARVSARKLGRSVFLAVRPDGALLDTLTRGGFRVASQGPSRETAGFWFEGAQT